jgi:hypothetical protein
MDQTEPNLKTSTYSLRSPLPCVLAFSKFSLLPCVLHVLQVVFLICPHPYSRDALKRFRKYLDFLRLLVMHATPWLRLRPRSHPESKSRTQLRLPHVHTVSPSPMNLRKEIMAPFFFSPHQIIIERSKIEMKKMMPWSLERNWRLIFQVVCQIFAPKQPFS